MAVPVKNRWVDQLVAAGMTRDAAAAKDPCFTAAVDALGRDPAIAWFVPGRIEFLGKHTDYCGGRSLLCAVEQGFCVAAAPRADGMVRVRAVDLGQEATFAVDRDLSPRDGHWSNYPMTVVRRVARNFAGPLVGMDLAFSSDLPPAAGMSSSSALVVATFLAMSDLNGLVDHPAYRANLPAPEDLAGYLGAVENGQTFRGLDGAAGVGTFGGSQDQTAILLSRPDRLVQYGFAPVTHEGDAPLPAMHVFVIADSGVVAEKTGAARDRYNRVSLAARAVLRVWQQASGRPDATLAAAVRGSPDAPARITELLRSAKAPDFTADELLARFEQFQTESERLIPEAADALRAGRSDVLGALVDSSQSAAERGLGNQVPETTFLAREGRRLGAVAASAFGAGFGGSVWAMVRADRADAFRKNWESAYHQRFSDRTHSARFLLTCAGPPALRLNME